LGLRGTSSIGPSEVVHGTIYAALISQRCTQGAFMWGINKPPEPI